MIGKLLNFIFGDNDEYHKDNYLQECADKLRCDPEYGPEYVRQNVTGGGISQPVRIVLDLMRTQPERFYFGLAKHCGYSAKDYVTGVEWEVWGHNDMIYGSTQEWTTADEKRAIHAEIRRQLDIERQNRLDAKNRIDREQHPKQRQEIANLYGAGQND